MWLCTAAFTETDQEKVCQKEAQHGLKDRAQHVTL
jgi:hypothetical protein